MQVIIKHKNVVYFMYFKQKKNGYVVYVCKLECFFQCNYKSSRSHFNYFLVHFQEKGGDGRLS